MKTLNATNFIAACAMISWATGTFAQHSGHSHGNASSTPAQSAPSASPYADEQMRAIKSLSASDVTGLQTGAGMAYAKAAELNGYPGPAHVLELAAQLQLDGEQLSATRKLMEAHKARASTLGEQVIEAERALDLAFSSRQVDAQRTEELTRQIGALQARLRAEHLTTHLAQTALLSDRQVASYQGLRGYGQALDSPQPLPMKPDRAL
jgi:hypothetical protein